jgi:hypothetical protein
MKNLLKNRKLFAYLALTLFVVINVIILHVSKEIISKEYGMAYMPGLYDCKVYGLILLILDSLALISFLFAHKNYRLKILYGFLVLNLLVFIYLFFQEPIGYNEMFMFESNCYNFRRNANWNHYWMVLLNQAILFYGCNLVRKFHRNRAKG